MADRAIIVSARAHLDADQYVIPVHGKSPIWDEWNTRRRSNDEVLAALKDPYCTALGWPGGAINNFITPLDFDRQPGWAWWCDDCRCFGIDPDSFPTVITPGSSMACHECGAVWKIEQPHLPQVCPECQARNIERLPGRHVYGHDVRQCLGNSEGLLRKLGINVRGNGHCVVPPSRHPLGGEYRWIRHILDFETIPPFPDFVYAAVAHRKPKTPPYTGPARPAKYRLERVKGLICFVTGLPEGQRHNGLYWAACVFGEMVRDGELHHGEAFDILIRTTERAGFDNPCKTASTIADGLARTGGGS